MLQSLEDPRDTYIYRAYTHLFSFGVSGNNGFLWISNDLQNTKYG